MFKKYHIEYTYSSQLDVRRMRKYIIENFKYLEYAENFDKKILNALEKIENETIVLLRVLKDGMNWQYIINLWLKKNNY